MCLGLTKGVSSVAGAPWRCGVLTTKGGRAGIGLGHLLGREHDPTPQSGVEAPRLSKRSLSRLDCCFFFCERGEAAFLVSFLFFLKKKVPSFWERVRSGSDSNHLFEKWFESLWWCFVSVSCFLCLLSCVWCLFLWLCVVFKLQGSTFKFQVLGKERRT